MSEDATERILAAIENLRQELGTEFRKDIQALSDRLDIEVKRWDERFCQLSKDTLTFTRNIITTVAVVAVLTPLVVKVLDSPIVNKLLDRLLATQ